MNVDISREELEEILNSLSYTRLQIEKGGDLKPSKERRIGHIDSVLKKLRAAGVDGGSE